MKLCFLILAGLVSVSAIWAGDRHLVVQTRLVQEPEMGLVKYFDLGWGEQRFVLFPPADWRVETSAQSGQIRFLARKGNAVITVQFTRCEAAEVPTGGEALRRAILPNESAPMVIDEFEALANDTAGRGMELGYSLQGQTMRCRGAVVAISGGFVTVTLNSAVEDFPHTRKIVDGVLRSFQKH